jgi:uncharacterized protein
MKGMDWRDVLFLIGTLFLVAFVCANAFLAARLLREARSLPNFLLHPAEMLARLAFVAICLALAWLSDLPPEQLGWRETHLAQNLALGALAGLVLQEVNHRSTKWAVRRFGHGIYNPGFLRGMVPRSRQEWFLAPLALFPAALAEELLFRSLVIGGFSVWLDPLLLALLFSALFGLAHAPQGRLGIAGAGILGFTLSLLFLWRWSLLTCLIANYLVNLIQLLRAPGELRWLDAGAERPG